jgi:hypothetical protein
VKYLREILRNSVTSSDCHGSCMLISAWGCCRITVSVNIYTKNMKKKILRQRVSDVGNVKTFHAERGLSTIFWLFFVLPFIKIVKLQPDFQSSLFTFWGIMAAINRHTDSFVYYADKREGRITVLYLYDVSVLRMLLKSEYHWICTSLFWKFQKRELHFVGNVWLCGTERSPVIRI